jgi:hypothetical protein
MKLSALLAFVGAAMMASATLVSAAEPVATVMVQRGKLLVDESFDGPLRLATAPANGKQWTHGWSGWRTNVGKWESANGVLTGTERAEDHHPAHAAYGLVFQDAVIQFDMRLEGCRMARWRATDDKDYVCSVRLTPDGVSLFKDDHDHDGPDKDELLAKLGRPIKPGEWHAILIEIRGDEIVAHFDGEILIGQHTLVGAKKQALRFGISKGAASLRNLRVWEATPKSDWPTRKAALATAGKSANP